FSHMLTREVAYETLPYAQRRQLHKRVAQQIEHEYVARMDSPCELLLHHYELAGDQSKVIRYATISGDKAWAVFALKESLDYYEQALRWLDEALSILPTRAGRIAAQIYATKCLTFFRKGAYEQSINWGRRGLALARRSRDRRLLAYAHHILSGACRELGKLKQALQHDRLS